MTGAFKMFSRSTMMLVASLCYLLIMESAPPCIAQIKEVPQVVIKSTSPKIVQITAQFMAPPDTAFTLTSSELTINNLPPVELLIYSLVVDSVFFNNFEKSDIGKIFPHREAKHFLIAVATSDSEQKRMFMIDFYKRMLTSNNNATTSYEHALAEAKIRHGVLDFKSSLIKK